MAVQKKNIAKTTTIDSYEKLVKHEFVTKAFHNGVIMTKELGKSSIFKKKSESARLPSEPEFYCIDVSYCLAHLLTAIQQMEHTVYYMSNFSPTSSMKRVGINRATHLLWSVENYIIRTQTIYDRTLIMIDRLFHIQNQPNRISHESIITNTHIARTTIPSKLKTVRQSIKNYYVDRNAIVHESSYLDEELRLIEGCCIVLSCEESDDKMKMQEILKESVREFIVKRKKEFETTNGNICSTLNSLFDEILPIYEKKHKELISK